MLKMVDGKLAALCAGLACAILPLFFFLRSDNVFFASIDSVDSSMAFVAAELAGFAICGLALWRSDRLRSFALSGTALVISGIVLCFGSLLACAIPMAPQGFSPVVAAMSACCTAFGSVVLMAAFLAMAASFSPMRVFAAMLLSFLLASVVWYVLMCANNLILSGVCVGAGGLASSVLIVRAFQRGANGLVLPFRLRGNAEASSAWRRYGFSVFGLLFNFFTMGLTFWPQDAGVSVDSGVLGKPGAYALIAVISLTSMRLLGRRVENEEENVDRILFTLLPLAIAIVLVSPFIDSVFAEAPFLILNLLPYAGIAGLNVIGYVSVVRISQSLRVSSASTFGSVVLGCAASMAVGMVLFAFLGSRAQMVSLTVLAVYLAITLIAFIQGKVGLAGQGGDQGASLESACIRISREFALSPREEEILGFLVRGRGAKHIGERLCISPETVRTHMKRIYEKCGVHAKEELLDLVENETRKGA